MKHDMDPFTDGEITRSPNLLPMDAAQNRPERFWDLPRRARRVATEAKPVERQSCLELLQSCYTRL